VGFILANPVRAGLINETERWPYCGAIIPGYPTLHAGQRDFWPKFLKLCQQQRRPDAGDRELPFRSSQRQ
jgi:hypothetical protein